MTAHQSSKLLSVTKGFKSSFVQYHRLAYHVSCVHVWNLPLAILFSKSSKYHSPTPHVKLQ